MAEPGGVTVSNPVGAGDGAGPKDGDDDEAGPSPDFHRRIGPLLSTEEGKPTPLALGCYAVLSCFPLIFLMFGAANAESIFYAFQHTETNADAEAIVTRLFVNVLYGAWLYCFHALRRVTRAGGELDQLGAGTELLSLKARRSLRRWRRRLIGLQCTLTLLFAAGSAPAIATGEGTGHHSKAWRRGSAVMVLTQFPLAMASVFTWWYTMKIAAQLSTTKVQQTADRIKQWRELKAAAGPGEEAAVWQEEIVKPVFRLAQVTMPTLSAGWGRSLLALSVGFGAIVFIFR